ncbi:MAG: NAD(P)/FAD-dependent oxidoreductase [Catenibacillus sp.]
MKKVLVIGGGAAGMMAAIGAAGVGHEVHLFEKNEKLGKKLYITGKGRCNITNNCDVESLLNHVISNQKFLYSAFYTFTSQDMMALLESQGLVLKTERGNRVFPVSDKSSDVISALWTKLKSMGVHIHMNTPVSRLLLSQMPVTFEGIELEDGKKVYGDSVIIATGGLSYKSTGSTGDGYRMAAAAGHTLVKTMPSLVPLNIGEDWCGLLQGLSLKNIRAAFKANQKTVYEDMGEMLFTHYGVSGPLILSGSAHITGLLHQNKKITLTLDLKPALDFDQLDARILRDFEENKNKQFRNALSGLLPSKMIPVIVQLSEIDPYKQVNEVSRTERLRLCRLMKELTMTVTGTRDYNEAVITRGGVCVKEVDPSTMKSKLVPGISFAGEVLDLDALTGGYNLQIAWSTAWLAGISV